MKSYFDLDLTINFAIKTVCPITEEDGRKLKNVYIDLILKTIVGLVLT